MNPLALALFIVAAILFFIDSWLWWYPPQGWTTGRLQSIDLLFMTLGFIANGGGLPH